MARFRTRLSSGVVAVSLLALFAQAVMAQSSGNSSRTGVQLEAKEIDRAGRKQILLNIKDVSGQAGPITAHVYFVARESGGARFIYAHFDLTVNLKGAKDAVATVEVPAPKSKPKSNKRPPAGFVYTYSGIGERDGWIMVGQVNGRALPTRSSSPALLEAARESLPALVAVYEKGAGGTR